MSYCAYITTINNISKHSNADRLQIVEVFGLHVIVDNSYYKGQRVVYFPVDGQLDLGFADENNLIRKKDENGNNIGGYMDANKRNITAIKLRGEKSEGLLLPVESLSKYTDITKLKDGDTITVLGDVEICKKYIPRTNRRTRNGNNNHKNKKHHVDVAPLFERHVETEQLAYHLSDFRFGDHIQITLKMHGCFNSETKVRMADGKLKRIREIKVGENVLCYDLKKETVKPTKVLTTFKNAPSYKWRKLKFSRNGLRGDRRGYIICTPNHPFWNQDTKSWIYASDLKIGMEVPMIFPSYVLTKQQKEVLIGNYLGDGCLLTRNNTSATMQTSYKNDKLDYLKYISRITGELYKIEDKIHISGYGTQMNRAKTVYSADIYNYFKNISTFKNHGKDKLKEGIINEFSILSMAILYMDDGSLAHSNYQKDRACFALCDYSEKDIRIIQKCFEKYGIQTVYYSDSKGYNRLRLNHKDAYKMFDLIYQYIPEVMRYKLPKEYRNKEYREPEPSYGKQSYVLVTQQVLENTEINKKYYEYDLETEEHNYIVGNAIVHNTSQRTGYLPMLQGYKRTILDKLFRREGKPIYEYGYVHGTRRTVLDNFDNGYYGNDSFRKPSAEFFEGKLHKGETVYYEVVGYVNETTPIMPSGNNKKVGKDFVRQYGDTTTFSYSCGKGQSDFYVYRMTMTNEDGDVVEYSPYQIKYRCEQMGCKYVPVFMESFIPNDTIVGAGEWVKRCAEEYYDGADPIGKNHIREGVVIRIVNRPKFTAYKHKNFNFKLLAGIITDNLKDSQIENMSEDLLSEI